jgi:hypothetical protein
MLASIPVFTVTTTLTEEPQTLVASVTPTGIAMRVVFERGEGAVVLQLAESGAVVRALVVYCVPAGKV